jgi:hypothetical protein
MRGSNYGCTVELVSAWVDLLVCTVEFVGAWVDLWACTVELLVYSPNFSHIWSNSATQSKKALAAKTIPGKRLSI